MKTMHDWWEDIVRSGSVWRHSGDWRAPHVVLSGGKHTDGFVDTLQFLCKLENLHKSACALAQEVRKHKGTENIDWVFGSPMAGILPAIAVADALGVKNIGFTEKNGDSLKCRFSVGHGSLVLRIEEMTTTGRTPNRAGKAILEKNPNARLLPIVGSFLTRCKTNPPPELKNGFLASVVDLEKIGIAFGEWEPDQCPLCQKGSPTVKDCKQVWDDLMITMHNPNHAIT
jgi:hypothetical protein